MESKLSKDCVKRKPDSKRNLLFHSSSILGGKKWNKMQKWVLLCLTFVLCFKLAKSDQTWAQMKAKSLTKKTMQITLLYLKRFSRYEFSKLEFAKKNRRFFWKWERVAETTSISVQFVQNWKTLEESLFYKTCGDESGLSREKSSYW